MDSFILTVRNSISSKQDFIHFLITMEEPEVSELVSDQWDLDDIRNFWRTFDGDMDRIAIQIYEYDEENVYKKMTLH